MIGTNEKSDFLFAITPLYSSSLATQEFNQLCLTSHVMADGALGNLVF